MSPDQSHEIAPSESRHDCGHSCCPNPSDPFHDHFENAEDCARCAGLDRLLQAVKS